MTSNTINDAVTMQPGAGGTLLSGRYRIVRQLGQGGMGSVWLAEDTQLDGKLFAIKMLPSILVSNKRAYRQLKDEALVAMRLVHPNIVQIRAFEENNGNPFLVMDYVDGETLDDYLAEKGRLSEDEVVKLLNPISVALDYAHTKGVVHRDVKPGNVMIAKDGTPYILDFGIAREMQETMTRVTGKMSSGTLLYMSPEQLRGQPPKPAQDVYSFAAMVYECLSGNPPFYRGAIEDQIKNEKPSPLRSDDAHAFADSVMAGLAKEPEDRPSTCVAVIDGRVPPVRHAGVEETAVLKGKVSATDANANASREEAARIVRLSTEIRIKVKEAKASMDQISSFRSEKENPFKTHVEEADAKWRIVDALERNPKSVREAMAVLDFATEAECAIRTELDWLRRNREALMEARKAEFEIEHAILPKLNLYGADRTADSLFQMGMSIYEEARQLLSSGDFVKGKDGIVSAKNKLWDAVGAARASYVERELELAQRYFSACKYDDCIKATEVILGVDGSNKEAIALKHAAEDGNLPRLNIVAMVDGREIPGAQLKIRNSEYQLPVMFERLEDGEIIDDARVVCEKDGVSYAGAIPEMKVDWRGLKTYAVSLENVWLKHGKVRKIRLPDGVFIEMIYVAPGEFYMGSMENEQGRFNNETLHKVRLTNGYWLGKYPVTQRQWRSVMGGNPSHFKGDDRPVDSISWLDCHSFMAKLSRIAAGQLAGKIRFPSEAEWEYACRAGTTGPSPVDAERVAWYDGNSDSKTHSVGTKPANAWGFYDMNGNVWEWCRDWYAAYTQNSEVDPVGGMSGTRRILRGGSWNSIAKYCRAASRGSHIPEFRLKEFGLRICCDEILDE